MTSSPSSIDTICVFAGSNPGDDPLYASAAAQLAHAISDRNGTLVYGGGAVGLMGTLADTAIDRGVHTIGVIPEALVTREVAHGKLDEQIIVKSMHERKATMAERADAFVALPGGLGTLEELFEVLTWAQLGLHSKPCGLLNTAGYYDPLLLFLDSAVSHGFVRAAHRSMIFVEENPADLFARFDSFSPPHIQKWIEREET